MITIKCGNGILIRPDKPEVLHLRCNPPNWFMRLFYRIKLGTIYKCSICNKAYIWTAYYPNGTSNKCEGIYWESLSV